VLARNGLAADEVEAHTGMFSGKTNDGYYDLGLQTAQVIREAVIAGRSAVLVDTESPAAPTVLVDTESPVASAAPVDTESPAAPAAPVDPKPSAHSAEMAEWGKEWQ